MARIYFKSFKKKCPSYTDQEYRLLFQMSRNIMTDTPQYHKEYISYKALSNLEYEKESFQYLKWYVHDMIPFTKEQRETLFYTPLKKIPVLINDHDIVIQVISRWRLKIGR